MSQQPELFPAENNPPKKEFDDFLSNRLIKLGDMMGDGLHHEPDGKWIEREYRDTLKALYPELYKNMRKHKADSTDKQMSALLAENKSSCCDAPLRQSRKGSKIAYCTQCNNRFKAKSKKK